MMEVTICIADCIASPCVETAARNNGTGRHTKEKIQSETLMAALFFPEEIARDDP
jgi:hypothetical protein